MGSKASSEKKSENKVKEKAILENKATSIYEVKDTSSSYKGLKSEQSSNSGDHSKSIENGSVPIIREKEDYDGLSHKIKLTLTWKEGGHAVYVTGSFSNWKQWFLMSKNPTNDKEFSIILDLPKGIYEFKFIVDSVWKCSKDYSLKKDGTGNVNNLIDTTHMTNYILEKQPVQQVNQKLDIIPKDDFSESIPQKCDMNLDAPFIPSNYMKSFNIETQSKQHLIGVEAYLVVDKNFAAYENNSYKNIASPPHVNLNLIYSNVNTNKRDQILNVSTTLRMRNKFVTYIYYKPKIFSA